MIATGTKLEAEDVECEKKYGSKQEPTVCQFVNVGCESNIGQSKLSGL